MCRERETLINYVFCLKPDVVESAEISGRIDEPARRSIRLFPSQSTETPEFGYRAREFSILCEIALNLSLGALLLCVRRISEVWYDVGGIIFFFNIYVMCNC